MSQAHFTFLLRSGTTVTRVGITGSPVIGFGGELSFLGFFASLLLFCCPLAMSDSCFCVLDLHLLLRGMKAVV